MYMYKLAYTYKARWSISLYTCTCVDTSTCTCTCVGTSTCTCTCTAKNLLFECSHVTMEHDIACVDVRSIGGDGASHLCAIGLWTDISTRVLRLPSLDTLHTQPLGGGESGKGVGW